MHMKSNRVQQDLKNGLPLISTECSQRKELYKMNFDRSLQVGVLELTKAFLATSCRCFSVGREKCFSLPVRPEMRRQKNKLFEYAILQHVAFYCLFYLGTP